MKINFILTGCQNNSGAALVRLWYDSGTALPEKKNRIKKKKTVIMSGKSLYGFTVFRREHYLPVK